MAAYSLSTTALALNADRKRLENILARYEVPGARFGRQGQARRLTRSAVVNLAVILQLEAMLSIPTSAAAELVATAREEAQLSDGPWQLVRGSISLVIDFAAIERALLAQLSEAIEIAPRPRRGRPPHIAAPSHKP